MSAAVCIALALGLLDRVCKHRARRGLRRRGRFFELTHLENRGAATGLLAAHPRWVLAFGCAVYALALALLLLWVDGGACLRYGAALLACGGLSNLVDRFVRGSVTDYLRFPRLPGRVGRRGWTLADFMILAGAALALASEIGVYAEKALHLQRLLCLFIFPLFFFPNAANGIVKPDQ